MCRVKHYSWGARGLGSNEFGWLLICAMQDTGKSFFGQSNIFPAELSYVISASTCLLVCHGGTITISIGQNDVF